MIRKLATFLWLLPLWLCGCATSGSSDESDRKYDVVHVAQVVGDEYFRIDPAFYERFRRTTFRYDHRFRRPDLPFPTKVDCSTAHNIGVVYLLIVEKRPASRKIKVKYVWEHDAFYLDDPKLNHFHTVFVSPNYSELFTAERLWLFDEYRADGVFTLTATIDGRPILQSSFEFVGCPSVEPDAN